MIRILQLQTKISARANLADERVTSEARTVGLIASCARRRDQPKDSTPRYGRGLLLVDCRRAAIILFAAGPRSGRLRPAASHRPADRQRQAGGFSAAGWSSRCVDTAANAATALSSRAAGRLNCSQAAEPKDALKESCGRAASRSTFMVELVQAVLATATPERVVAGSNTIEVARLRITDAGRKVLGGK
jgi:hypothetical protein